MACREGKTRLTGSVLAQPGHCPAVLVVGRCVALVEVTGCQQASITMKHRTDSTPYLCSRASSSFTSPGEQRSRASLHLPHGHLHCLPRAQPVCGQTTFSLCGYPHVGSNL